MSTLNLTKTRLRTHALQATKTRLTSLFIVNLVALARGEPQDVTAGTTLPRAGYKRVNA